MADKILLVDDELELLKILSRTLSRHGFQVQCAASAEEGIEFLSETAFDLVVSDMALPGMDGLGFLQKVREFETSLPFIIMTGVGTIENAVAAIQNGAFHYITKPFQTNALVNLAGRAIEYGHLNKRLDKQFLDENEDHSLVIGSNKAVQIMLRTIDKVSDSTVPVLIQGETGTGKSLFAKKIHAMSSRREDDFYIIDCASLAEQVLESELFGHVRGAFTGAVSSKRGLLEEAQGGTIFLDEIGELSPTTQMKLLRAVQENEIKPVGGNKPVKIDVRFISATSRNLDEDVESGRFRKDLYYRLAVIPLMLPPLRDRREDILLFVDKFVNKFNKKYNKKITQVLPGVLQQLMDFEWKGNIRELENIIERAVLLADGEVITQESISVSAGYSRESSPEARHPLPLKRIVERAEKQAIVNVLSITEGNRTMAANILGIGRRTLYDKLAMYHLD
ncbi:sigma-54 dependent transcriptional regulator [Desulfoluna sp.]|uniref:sigma-54-dependent transcriptional regulator n=1 Tax=Desulfoluna sp. TaxID=2045199 RepID=UPI002603929F|nr:sigma-54 dependent transcriptional regulator [Desulfoluna sp.]